MATPGLQTETLALGQDYNRINQLSPSILINWIWLGGGDRRTLVEDKHS